MSSPSVSPQDSFSQFAFYLSKQPNVTDALNLLHKKHIILNTNLILYTLWFAIAHRGRLQKQNFRTLQETIYMWDDRIVSALKRLLKKMQGGHHAKIRPKIQQVQQWLNEEIAQAEKIERQFLGEIFIKTKPIERSETQRLLDACLNLTNYFKFMQIRLDEFNQQALVVILQAVFPNLAAIDIIENLKRAVITIKINDHPYLQLSLEDL